jgi:apolipoprotein N-acyltransferase
LPNQTQPRFDLLALISGGLLTLAFAPFNCYLLGIVSPALYLCCLNNVSPSRAFLRGLLYGLAFFGTGVYWVFNSIHVFGNASFSLSCFITGGFIVLLASFLALMSYFLTKQFPLSSTAKTVFAFPVFWVSTEIIRSGLFTGFPWLLLGYSQINSPLKGFAPLFSVYGVSLFCIICSGLLYNVMQQLRLKAYKPAAYYFLAITSIMAIGWSLSLITWTKPLGGPIQVSLIQGNVAQETKWSPDNIQPTLDLYKRLTDTVWSSKIIAWPEAAIPITLQDAADFVQNITTDAAKHHSTIFAGIPIKATDSYGYYNAIIGLGADESVYLKKRLVPFGEYTPFPKLLGRLLGSLNIPMSDFIPGKTLPAPLTADGIRLAAYICYEVAYTNPSLAADDTLGMLLAITNDGWFGRSIAQAQHLQMAQMRALELNRPLLFVGNTGLTATVGANGTIQTAAPAFKTYVLTDKIQPRSGTTPWQVLGSDPMIVLLISLLLAAKILKRRHEQ